jgi:hypothetical protein
MKLRTLATMALGATTFFSASSALAYEPAQVHEGASIGGLIGFGVDYYGFATGIRGGYTLPAHVYLGGTFLFNTGFAGWGAGFTTGFEGGYEFAAGPVTVRPYGGVGLALEQYGGGGPYLGNGNICGYTPTGAPIYCNGNGYGYGGSSTSLAFWAGGTCIYDFKGGPWFVMGDVRFGDAPALYYEQGIFAVLVGGGYEF